MFRTNKYEKMSDEKLMECISNKNSKAFDELYRRYSHKLLNFFNKYLNYNGDLAGDFLHDFFLKIIEKPEMFDTSQRFSTWAYTVAVNMCRNYYRSPKSRTTELKEDVANKLQYRESKISSSISSSVDNVIFTERLNNELDNLSAAHKTVFILRYYENLPLKDIALITNCSEGTVKSRLFYSLKKLSSRLCEFKELLIED